MKQTFKSNRFLPITITAILGVCLSVWMFMTVATWSDEHLNIEFQSRASGYANTIENGLDEYLSTSEFLKDHLRFSDHIQRERFKLFANQMLSRYPGIQALSWNPLVHHQDRGRYEFDAQTDGFSNFSFTERSKEGALIRAANRDEYVVVYMIEPLEKNKPALGFDIASNPVRLEAIQKAFDTGKAVATGKITLVQETGSQFGALILNPIYQNNGADPVKGLAVEVIRIGDAIESALTEFSQTDIEFHLYDVTSKEKGDFLYKKVFDENSIDSMPLGMQTLKSGLHLSTKFDFATRKWLFIFTPSKTFLAEHRQQTAWIVLFSGIGLTFLLTFYLLNRLTYIKEIEKRIQSETRIKKDLKKSEAFLSTIYQNSEVGIFVVKVNGVGDYIYEGINQTHEKLFGVKHDEIVGHPPDKLFEFFPSEAVEFIYQIYDSCVTTKQTYVSEDYLKLNGEQGDWWLSRVKPLMDEKGEVYRLIGSAINITERKNSEKALIIKSQEEEKLRIMLESLWNVASMGTENIKTICDFALEEIERITESQYSFLGFIDSEETKMTLHSWSPKAMNDCQMSDRPLTFPIQNAGIWARSIRERKPVIINNYSDPHKDKLGLPDGHIDITRTLSVPIIGKERIEAIVAVANKASDYTVQDQEQVKAFISNLMILIRQKQTEEAKEQLEIQLRQLQKSEAIGTLAGGIAHDFNNILFPITGFAEILKEDIEPDSPMNECVDEILIGAKRAKDLVMQILAFSRQTEEELKPLKPHIIIKEVIKLAKATIPSTIEIHQAIDTETMTIIADPTQIHQVAMNLITNAYHAMEDDGGRLSILLKNIEHSDSLNIENLDAGPYVQFSVEDTGIGMEQNTADKIFDPYFSTKPKDKGTGLGLSVVQGIVKNYGGEIKVHSRPGQGTRFDIYLPAFKGSVKSIPTEQKETILKGNENILLVDDEKEVLNLETKILTRLGYTVDACDDSMEALGKIQSNANHYDMVITDMTMPKMTGDTLAQEIKEVQPDLPIIVCTGFSEKLTTDRATSIGIDDILTKPIITRTLASSIRNILDHRG